MNLHSRNALQEYHNQQLQRLAEEDPAFHLMVTAVRQSSRDNETLHREKRPGGKCRTCLNRQYLICVLSDKFCVDTFPYCRTTRKEGPTLIQAVLS